MDTKKPEFVKDLCLNKKEVDIDDGQRRGNRYGRDIDVVYCDDGINLNEALMKNNLEKIYTDYCDISEFSNRGWAKPYC